jgi:hypothetical protein
VASRRQQSAAAASENKQAYNNLAARRKERNGENVIEINQIMKMAKMKKAAKSIIGNENTINALSKMKWRRK